MTNNVENIDRWWFRNNKRQQTEVKMLTNEFYNLQNIFIDKFSFGNHVYTWTCIFKGNKLYQTGKLSIKVH